MIRLSPEQLRERKVNVKERPPENQHYNSFIANKPCDEFQCDLGNMYGWVYWVCEKFKHPKPTDLQIYPYVLITCDIFSRYVETQVIGTISVDREKAFEEEDVEVEKTDEKQKEKTATKIIRIPKLPRGKRDAKTVAEAFEQSVKEMGEPLVVYTDDGNEFKGRFDEYCKEQDMQHVAVAKSKAPYAESALYAYKRTLFKWIKDNSKPHRRLNQKTTLKIPNWSFAEFSLSYNKQINKTPMRILNKLSQDERGYIPKGNTPESIHFSKRPEDWGNIKQNMMEKVLDRKNQFPKKYPTLNVNDKVSVFLGAEGEGEHKHRFYAQGTWSKPTYKIVRVLPNFPNGEERGVNRGFTVYEVMPPANRRRFWLRFQLYKPPE